MRSEEPDELALDIRFAVFFDFLGASNAALTWPRERVYEFVDLLISVASVQSAEDITGGPQPDGGYRINVTPEVTTFSDNVVLSYGDQVHDDHPNLLPSVWTEIMCKDANRVLAAVAEMGLRIGLLLRGGVACGELYHQSNVVFGKALVEAVALERSADLPRVVISNTIVEKITHIRPEDSLSLARDADGKWHLNYIAEMVRQAPTDADSFDRWRGAHLAQIDAEIASLEDSPDPEVSRRSEKWRWFKRRFQEESGGRAEPS